LIKVIPFEPEHIFGMKPLIKDKFFEQALQNMDYLKNLKQYGVAYSGFTQDGVCVGAAGVRQINLKTFEGWAILSEDSHKQIKSIIRAVDLFIQNYFEFDVADRFQATVKLSYKKGHRFAKLLKFEPEGILKCYEDGADFMMYARTNTWLK
jgi:hypothetical protein